MRVANLDCCIEKTYKTLNIIIISKQICTSSFNEGGREGEDSDRGQRIDVLYWLRLACAICTHARLIN